LRIASVFQLPLNAFDIPRCYEGDLSAVVITEGLIRDRVRRLAKDIHETIGADQLSLLCVLKGSYKFFNALVDELGNARWLCKEPMTVDFIRCKSYEDDVSSGTVQIIGLSNLEELRGKNIVDDIVDTGLTLSKLIHTLRQCGAKKIWTALLLSKRVPRKVTITEDFVAFNIPNKFIVGYGLDYNQKFRDLNHICVMSPAGIEKYKST
uniref:Hypoxanthine phosphoribosyltransferase n=1 Tax=Angiostrongylus cantonensis TaxID=6313 RepID=A0A0K0DJU7_ANGCA